MINCKRCNKSISKALKGCCKYCYAYLRMIDKQKNSPLIKCQCSDECQTMIYSITRRGYPATYAKGHVQRLKNRKDIPKKYKYLYKPHYKYSDKRGRIAEHRYIMYIYLSILNNKPTYLPKNHDVHHKNKNGLDNRIENLELVDRKTHMVIHDLFNGLNGKKNKKDMSDRICNLCNANENETRIWMNDIVGYICGSCYGVIRFFSKKTFSKRPNRFCNICNINKTTHWFNDINGFLCQPCYDMVRNFRNRFFSGKSYNVIIDRSYCYCNLCKSDKTISIKNSNGKYYDNWYNDIDGYLCNICYKVIKYYQKKFY